MEEVQVKSHQAETTENRNRRLKEKMRADSNKITIVYDSCAANVHVQCYGDAERAHSSAANMARWHHMTRAPNATQLQISLRREGGFSRGCGVASLRHALSQILHRFSDLIAAQYASRFAHQTHHGTQVDRPLGSSMIRLRRRWPSTQSCCRLGSLRHSARGTSSCPCYMDHR